MNRVMLIVFSLNPSTKELYVLLDGDEFPVYYIQTDVKKSLYSLITSYLNVSAEWLPCSLIEARCDEDEKIEVVYTAILPESIPLKRGGWTRLNDLLTGDFNDKEILGLAARKVWR